MDLWKDPIFLPLTKYDRKFIKNYIQLICCKIRFWYIFFITKMKSLTMIISIIEPFWGL